MRLASIGIGVRKLVSDYLTPGGLFLESFWVKGSVAALALCLSAAFAFMVFIRSLAEYRFSGQAIGSKLLRALREECRSQRR